MKTLMRFHLTGFLFIMATITFIQLPEQTLACNMENNTFPDSSCASKITRPATGLLIAGPNQEVLNAARGNILIPVENTENSKSSEKTISVSTDKPTSTDNPNSEKNGGKVTAKDDIGKKFKPETPIDSIVSHGIKK